MSLKHVAKETLTIIERGGYINQLGQAVSFIDAQRAAVDGTQLFRPAQLVEMLARPCKRRSQAPRIEVTDEKSQAAARRLVQDEGIEDLVLLNFASARNAGGGFLKGAKAQEEDLARSSALYACLVTQPEYYAANRRQKSLLYTDHMIYSPRVPFFRIDRYNLLDAAYLASVITAPAPNAGEVLRRDPDAESQIDKALVRRAGMVLSVARDKGHHNLLLGAWGCGVFRNDPTRVADVFANWLTHEHFLGHFDRIVFGVYDPSKEQKTLAAFQNRLG